MIVPASDPPDIRSCVVGGRIAQLGSAFDTAEEVAAAQCGEQRVT